MQRQMALAQALVADVFPAADAERVVVDSSVRRNHPLSPCVHAGYSV